MTIRELVQASTGLRKLAAQDLPVREAWEIMKLIDRLNPLLGFAGVEEAKAAGNAERLGELWSMEPEELRELRPVRIHAEGLKLAPADVKFLEPLVEFIGIGGD